jgi:DNA-binding transcriptional regulator of glucitol operon
MKKPAWRYLRTFLIGTFCVCALAWIAIRQFGVSPRELLELLLATGVVVLLVIAMAGGAALLWVGLRKFLRGRRGD